MKIAIIGGTGFALPDYLTDVKEISVETPFGKPEPVIYTGKMDGVEIIHLSRNGKNHELPLTRINYRANMFALKQLQVDHIFATGTCGSLQEEICPGEVIIFDQFIDMTKQPVTGIIEELNPGSNNYVSMAEPFSDELRDSLIESAIVQGITVHTKGIAISIDGQRSSSRAESRLYRCWGADVVNMTTAPEAILANELGIAYAAVSLCTGYDSWRQGDSAPEPNEKMNIVGSNYIRIIKLLSRAVKKIE
ncbi:MAG TPA: MTAP family purine nucleoside phosphorylase [Bacteroidales bacterium]|jgi:5'-methylthioadenosine phosphorylase|nr:MTAP family purine nucleoside phosphorylase [Bacteroidales bacterium]